jgi:flagellar motility protein MotE (MotC chaperone)
MHQPAQKVSEMRISSSHHKKSSDSPSSAAESRTIDQPQEQQQSSSAQAQVQHLRDLQKEAELERQTHIKEIQGMQARQDAKHKGHDQNPPRGVTSSSTNINQPGRQYK